MDAPPASSDFDVASMSTPLVVRAAGGLLLFAGLLTALTSVQTLTMDIRIRGAMAAAPWVLLLLGLAAAYAGAMLMRARGWTVAGAPVLAGVLFLATGGWAVFSLTGGLLSLFAMLDPVLALLGLVLALAALGPARRTAAARAKLAAQGLGMGL